MSFKAGIMLAGVDGLHVGFASLHSAFNLTGANEVSTAHIPIPFTSFGFLSAKYGPVDVPAPVGATFSWIGLWSYDTPSAFLCMFPYGSTDHGPFVSDSSNFNLLRAPYHQLAIGDQVLNWVNPSITYTVYNVVADTIELADSTGAPINLVVPQSGTLQSIFTGTVPASGLVSVRAELTGT